MVFSAENVSRIKPCAEIGDSCASHKGIEIQESRFKNKHKYSCFLLRISKFSHAQHEIGRGAFCLQ